MVKSLILMVKSPSYQHYGNGEWGNDVAGQLVANLND
jgi:hypothetical protein